MNEHRLSFPIGQTITYYRKQKGWTINKLANEAGVSQSYLRDIELENKNPTVEFLSLICDKLEITLCDFFYDPSKDSSTDILIERISHLNSKQRTTLLAFLDTI